MRKHLGLILCFVSAFSFGQARACNIALSGIPANDQALAEQESHWLSRLRKMAAQGDPSEFLRSPEGAAVSDLPMKLQDELMTKLGRLYPFAAKHQVQNSLPPKRALELFMRRLKFVERFVGPARFSSRAQALAAYKSFLVSSGEIFRHRGHADYGWEDIQQVTVEIQSWMNAQNPKISPSTHVSLFGSFPMGRASLARGSDVDISVPSSLHGSLAELKSRLCQFKISAQTAEDYPLAQAAELSPLIITIFPNIVFLDYYPYAERVPSRFPLWVNASSLN